MKINSIQAVPFSSGTNKSHSKNVKSNPTFQAYHQTSAHNIVRNIALGLAGVTVTLAGIGSCDVVQPGERGIKIRLGKVQPEVYEEGLHFKWPLIESMKKTDIKTMKTSAKTNSYTKDVQQAEIDYAVNYNVEPTKVNKLYQEVGRDYESKIIAPVLEGIIKDIIGTWNAQDLIGNREKAANEILAKLQEKLKTTYINVTGFQMTDINFSDNFEKAIEEKVTAEQRALQAKNKTVQVEEEAKQKIITAEAEAKSMAIRSAALSQNKSLVEYEAVQKWDGKLPQYMMGNSVPFVNINTQQGK